MEKNNYGEFITRWDDLCQDQEYIIFPVHTREDGKKHLCMPVGFCQGRQVQRIYRERCYVALPVPKFKGLDDESSQGSS